MSKTADGTLQALIEEQLVPEVSVIDLEGHYPQSFLQALGAAGYYQVRNLPEWRVTERKLRLIETVSQTCNSTAFLVWCHLTGLSYVAHGESRYLLERLLPRLESGEILCGTGLSNAMKYYAGLEPLKLRAERVSGGYVCDGVLPFVSNLAPGQWFGAIAQVDDRHRVMLFIPCDADGLTLRERRGFMGMNGTATYHCHFERVFVPDDYVLSEDADALVRRVRTGFVLSQVGMALGLCGSAIASMAQLAQAGANRFLPASPEGFAERYERLRERTYSLAEQAQTEAVAFPEVARVRLDSAYLAIDVATTAVLYSGGAGYLQSSTASRRLREAFFVALVTPTVKHLERVLKEPESCLL